jgi:phenylacetate-CoA ligase
MFGITGLLTVNKLRKRLFQPLDILRVLQLKKLQAMGRHAYETVPYYRELFDRAGVKPHDIQTTGDLERIPITTRAQIRDVPEEDILSRNVSRIGCKRITTGGSSGIPLAVFLRHRDSEYNDLVWARTSLENGKRLGDVTAYFKFNFPSRPWFEYLGIWRRDIISILLDTREKIDRLRKSKPDIIRGNPFELVNLARYVRDEMITGITPRLVFSMGSLLDQQARKLIETTFKAEVFDFYGATEFGCIAWECSAHNGYHINIDTVVLEIIKQGRPARLGEIGRIVCTNLNYRAMPFIRYDTGDMGMVSQETCRCGRIFPLLKSLEGRADDFLRSPTGEWLSPSRIVNQLKLIAGVGQFRIIQERKDRLLIRLVPDKNFSDRTEHLVRQTMIGIMGKPIRIDIQLGKSIPVDPSGKIRSLVSKVGEGLK